MSVAAPADSGTAPPLPGGPLCTLASSDGPATDQSTRRPLVAGTRATHHGPEIQVPACRHCGQEQVIAWGHFRTRPGQPRQRYRCLACTKTFSVYTGTALQDVKHTDRWSDHTQCMADGLSLRATAARLGIHLSTAFRWRHRVLNALDTQPAPCLQGEVAAGLAYVPYSQKGSTGAWDPWPPVCVLLLQDENQESVAVPMAFGIRSRPCPQDAGGFPLEQLATDAVLCTAGKSRYIQGLCQDLGLGYRTSGSPRLLAGIGAFRTGLPRWLRRFHGVATRYLVNYLNWFRAAVLPNRRRRHPAAVLLAAATEW